MMNKEKTLFHNYMILYAMTYGAMGGVFPLIGQYLASIGFTGTQIGSITGGGTFAAVFATAFWGGVYNKAKSESKVVMLLCLVSAIMMIGLRGITIYVLFLISYAVFFFFQQPINALSDAMVMEDTGDRFNIIRMFGAIGYAIAVFIAGEMSDRYGTQIIFMVGAIGFTISLLSVYIIGRARGSKDTGRDTSEKQIEHIEKKSNIEGYKELFKNSTYVKILIVAIFVGGTNVANNTYFSFLYQDAGGDLSGVGITFLLMVGSEAVVMFFSSKLSARFTLERMILIAILISCGRFLWYATVPSTTMLTALFFLQGMVNGIILVEFIKYVAKVADLKIMGLAVSTYYLVSSQVSGIICQFVGGVMLDLKGGAGVYLLFGIMNVIGAVLYFAFGLHKTGSVEIE